MSTLVQQSTITIDLRMFPPGANTVVTVYKPGDALYPAIYITIYLPSVFTVTAITMVMWLVSCTEASLPITTTVYYL